MSSGFDPSVVRLIGITDDLRDGIGGLASRAGAAVRGGATMIQVRLKNADARTLVEATRAILSEVRRVDAARGTGGHRTPVVVNDRLDVALAADADGVHLGFDDLPVSAARLLAPPPFIIGASVGEPAEVPAARLADYVGIGPVHTTATKADAGAAIGVDGFVALAHTVGLPAVGVGGIDVPHIVPLRRAGAAGVAVVRAMFGAADVEAAARALRQQVDIGVTQDA